MLRRALRASDKDTQFSQFCCVTQSAEDRDTEILIIKMEIQRACYFWNWIIVTSINAICPTTFAFMQHCISALPPPCFTVDTMWSLHLNQTHLFWVHFTKECSANTRRASLAKFNIADLCHLVFFLGIDHRGEPDWSVVQTPISNDSPVFQCKCMLCFVVLFLLYNTPHFNFCGFDWSARERATELKSVWHDGVGDESRAVLNLCFQFSSLCTQYSFFLPYDTSQATDEYTMTSRNISTMLCLWTDVSMCTMMTISSSSCYKQ